MHTVNVLQNLTSVLIRWLANKAAHCYAPLVWLALIPAALSSHWLVHRCSEGGAESGSWNGLKHLAASASNSTTHWDLHLLCFHFAFIVTRTALFLTAATLSTQSIVAEWKMWKQILEAYWNISAWKVMTVLYHYLKQDAHVSGSVDRILLVNCTCGRQ